DESGCGLEQLIAADSGRRRQAGTPPEENCVSSSRRQMSPATLILGVASTGVRFNPLKDKSEARK
ncbi:unnamed protein product, partial [Nesidiocoris tenuis]